MDPITQHKITLAQERASWFAAEARVSMGYPDLDIYTVWAQERAATLYARARELSALV